MYRDRVMCTLCFVLGFLCYWVVFDLKLVTGKGSISREIENMHDREFFVIGHDPNAKHIWQMYSGGRDPRGIWPHSDEAGRWTVWTFRSKEEADAAKKMIREQVGNKTTVPLNPQIPKEK